ncbi:hypothetical protein BCV72DRAFT_300814 [Rhizopus microsporus var. microsporus]|uniref:Uncharacterized protein n=1 Tax=Rhizopus microsporus var. microsporus TaxID=86635 RepID=A0A1X0RHN6_RHIZD|nr:hypothetical protein BCV72DRAFT_300814 [Rhizopus microsporus var. microsporus]
MIDKNIPYEVSLQKLDTGCKRLFVYLYQVDDYLVLKNFINSMQNCYLAHLTRAIIPDDEVRPNVDRIKSRLAGTSVWRAIEEAIRTNWRGLKKLPTPENDHPDHSHGLDCYQNSPWLVAPHSPASICHQGLFLLNS